MNEIIKDYIHQISCKIVVNKLQKVLTYIICRQMDLKNHVGILFTTLAFHSTCWNVRENLMWGLVAKKLHMSRIIYTTLYTT